MPGCPGAPFRVKPFGRVSLPWQGPASPRGSPLARHIRSRPDETDPDQHPRRDLLIRIGDEELVIRQRYETLSILNDTVAALMFIVGSALFFSPSTSYAATWLFLVGSASMLIRPAIRLSRRIHLRRRQGTRSGAHETSMDF